MARAGHKPGPRPAGAPAVASGPANQAVAMEYRIHNTYDRLSSALADEQNDAVVCESGFGPPETIDRVDHNYTLSITASVGLR